MSDTAYFVRQPRRLKDLFALHVVDREQPYEIVKAITLSLIDYENFITDMTVDRQFLEDNASLCSANGVWKCLLIQREKKSDGILVIPLDRRWVGWAAYYQKNNLQLT